MKIKTLLIPVLLIGLIGVLALAWYLGSPLFINRTVDEAFPSGLETQKQIIEAASEGGDPMESDSMDQSKDEMTAVDPTPTGMKGEDTMDPDGATPMADAKMGDEMSEGNTPSANEPILLLQGQFRDADDFHQGSGEAGIYRLADGSRVLRLESFMVTNGPDLHVLLATAASPTDQSTLGEMIDLGELKGNLGDQNYVIPAEANLDAIQSVVIYCQPFHVVFSVASVQP